VNISKYFTNESRNGCSVVVSISNLLHFFELIDKTSRNSSVIDDFLGFVGSISEKYEGRIDGFSNGTIQCLFYDDMNLYVENALKFGFEVLDNLKIFNAKYLVGIGFEFEVAIGIHDGEIRRISTPIGQCNIGSAIMISNKLNNLAEESDENGVLVCSRSTLMKLPSEKYRFDRILPPLDGVLDCGIIAHI
jgi:hypothetical protein